MAPGPELLHVGRAAGGEGLPAAQLTRPLAAGPLLRHPRLRDQVTWPAAPAAQQVVGLAVGRGVEGEQIPGRKRIRLHSFCILSIGKPWQNECSKGQYNTNVIIRLMLFISSLSVLYEVFSKDRAEKYTSL